MSTLGTELLRVRVELAEIAALLPGPRVSVRRIMEASCSEWGVSLHDLLSERRSQRVAVPRAAAMHLARELTAHSLPALGRLFRRDHTTVIAAIAAHERRCLVDPTHAARTAALHDQLLKEARNGHEG